MVRKVSFEGRGYSFQGPGVYSMGAGFAGDKLSSDAESRFIKAACTMRAERHHSIHL